MRRLPIGNAGRDATGDFQTTSTDQRVSIDREEFVQYADKLS